MVKVKVKLLDSGDALVHSGSEVECEKWLRKLFPGETEGVSGLLAGVKAVNDRGFADVDVEVVPVDNLLLPDYDRLEPADDPWPREADLPSGD